MELPAVGTPAQGNWLPTPSFDGQPPALFQSVPARTVDHLRLASGDVPRGIIADIIEDLGLTRDEFYFKRF